MASAEIFTQNAKRLIELDTTVSLIVLCSVRQSFL